MARSGANAIMREKSRVLRIIVPAVARATRSLRSREAYRKQFAQKSVGIVMRPACVSF